MFIRAMVKEKKSNRSIITIFVLAVLLIIAVGYIGYMRFNEAQMRKQIDIYQQGAQAGYQQAIVQIAQQSTTCQPVPLKVQNQTINLIAIECLQQAQEQE